MPPMRVEPIATIRTLLEGAGWSRQGKYVYLSPDGITTFPVYMHLGEEYETVSIPILLNDLRERGLDDLADHILDDLIIHPSAV